MVMLGCWHPVARLRPSFRQLVERVSDVVDTMQRQLQQTSQRPVTMTTDYVNDNQPKISFLLDPAALDACRSTVV